MVASVFFGSDPANPDNYPHFYTDVQMFTEGPTQPDPQYFMNRYCSWEIASKANKWQGRNVTRWQTRSTTSSTTRPMPRWIPSSRPRCSSA